VIAATVGAILLATITLYAVLGGADFGGGLWDLLAGGDRRGRAPRQLIDESITPVWEANHVWLVFALVIFWTAFPHAFASVMIAVALPLWLAVLGIVLRGAGFAFRKEAHGISMQRALGAIFALSSVLTPFFMGTVVGAIAAGQIPANASHASVSAWTGALPLLTGFLFVAACGYLAAVYLIGEAARRGDRSLEGYFTRRAQAAGIVTGGLSLAALTELQSADAAVFDHLTGRALALVIIAGLAGLAVLVLLAASRLRGVRALAALSVAAVIWGWGVAQYPVLLSGTSVTLANAGAPHASLVAIVWLFVVAVVLVGPSFALLFTLHGRQILGGSDVAAMPGISPARGTPPAAGQPGRQRPGSGSQALALAVIAAGAVARALARRRNR
jgi:cytochrome bd ubiquinol oxidase subunit II